MITKKIIQFSSFTSLAIMLMYVSICAKEKTGDFKYYRTDNVERERAISISKSVGLEKWPKSNIFRSAPKIDTSLLENPKLVTRYINSFVPDMFVDESNGVLFDWSLYGSSSLSMKMLVAPDSNTANEFLILERSSTPLPDEGILSVFSSKNRLEGLGTIAFSNPLMFVRDNIAVIIYARGDLAKEGLPLAKKIDTLIQKQPILNANQIKSRRPVISISPKADKDANGNKTLTFKISPPEGQTIADVKTYIDDQFVSNNKDGKISLQDKTGKFKVKVVAISSELIANVQEIDVDVP